MNKNSSHFSRAHLVPSTVLVLNMPYHCSQYKPVRWLSPLIYTRGNWGPMKDGKSLNWEIGGRMGIREERALGLNHVDLSLQLPDTLGPSWCFETNMVVRHGEQQKAAAESGMQTGLRLPHRLQPPDSNTMTWEVWGHRSSRYPINSKDLNKQEKIYRHYIVFHRK